MHGEDEIVDRITGCLTRDVGRLRLSLGEGDGWRAVWLDLAATNTHHLQRLRDAVISEIDRRAAPWNAPRDATS